MDGSQAGVDTTAPTDALSEHMRTHRRWARTVLALYGALVVVGLMATLVHQSIIAKSSRSEMQVALQKSGALKTH